MAKESEPPTPATWDVYKIAKKAIWLGTIEAPDKKGAVERCREGRSGIQNRDMAPVCGGTAMTHRKGEITRGDLKRKWLRILLGVAGRTHRLRRLSVDFVINLNIRGAPCRAPRNPRSPKTRCPPAYSLLACPNRYPNERSSVGKRALITLVRVLLIFCIGVSATLAWQSYGDREMIARSYPQLSGLAPQVEPVPPNAADVIGLASRTASSPDQQQPNAILLDLGVVQQNINQLAISIASSQGRTDRMATTQEQIARSVDRMATTQEQIARGVDRMATTQEQIARSVDQLRADQEQVTREITKLQEIEQSIRSKNSGPSPRLASAPAPKPISQPPSAPAPKPISQPASASAPKPISHAASASAPKPVSRASQEPTVP
jgi:hypothetical protein